MRKESGSSKLAINVCFELDDLIGAVEGGLPLTTATSTIESRGVSKSEAVLEVDREYAL